MRKRTSPETPPPPTLRAVAYAWRRLTPEQRREILESRKSARRPSHSPPHFPHDGAAAFLVSAACYEHRPYIGRDPGRLDAFSAALVAALAAAGSRASAWCVLPNHYHVLVETPALRALVRELGRLHGRSSRAWNLEESSPGRRVFFRAFDRGMRSEAHVLATMNYVHHNAVHHGHAEQWTDWPWSSAAAWIEAVGVEEARRIWREFPVADYGRGWDEAGM